MSMIRCTATGRFKAHPLKKVFTVLTRGIHRKTDFGKIGDYKVANITISGLKICLGIKDDNTLGVFEIDGNKIATIMIKKGVIDLSLCILGESDEIYVALHALIALVQEINKEL